MFIGNEAIYIGGVIVIKDSDSAEPVTITNCSFSHNKSINGPGGALYNYDDSDAVIITNSDSGVCPISFCMFIHPKVIVGIIRLNEFRTVPGTGYLPAFINQYDEKYANTYGNYRIDRITEVVEE